MSQTDIFNYAQFSKDIATSGQPLADEFAFIAGDGYEAVINIAMHDSDDAVANEGNIVTALGMSYFHIPVPFDAPTKDQVRVFIKLLGCLKEKKIWIHCAANYRVSAFLYLYQRHVHGVSEEEARSPVFEFWHPDETWRNLMGLSADDLGL